MKNIIIICGVAGTGKTVLARCIKNAVSVHDYQLIDEFSIPEILIAVDNAIQNKDACIFTTQAPAEHFKGKGAWIISTTY